MKCAVLSFLFLLSSISLAFSQERTSLIIQKNTEVSLGSLLSPILDSKTGAETIFLNQLYLGEGAKLYINRPITIDAKKIILKPKSTIHTLGNSLTIKTDVFDVLNFSPPGLTLSEDQRKELMGRIDTRHKEEKHNGKDGQQAGQVGHKGENARFYQGYPPYRVDDAQVGNPPEGKGEDGTSGRNAGSVTLYVRKFLGGYFDTRGGKGGRGGCGGKGGDGGNGLSMDYWDKEDLIGSGINGARGGEGGRGGNGGNGGNGGTISITYETGDLSSEKTLFILNEGGKGGEGGEGGMGGDGGLGGKSSRRDEDRSGQEIICWYDGKNGAQGPIGARGDRGADGAQGGRAR